MTVVVRKDSRSSESALGNLLFEDISQVSQLFQLPYGSGVPHPEWSSSHQDIQELSQTGSGSGLGGTFLLAGPIESKPDFDIWSTLVGMWNWEPQIFGYALQIGGLDMSGTYSRLQETSSVGSALMTVRRYLCRSFIRVAESEEEIVAAMRWYGLNFIADRLNRLRTLIAEDPDEPNLVLESLRSFADFFMQQDLLPVPEIGAGPEGYLEAEWRIPANGELMAAFTVARWAIPEDRYWGDGDGILAMKFLPSGLIQFAAVSGPAGRGKERLRASGVLPKDDIMTAIQTFASRLVVL